MTTPMAGVVVVEVAVYGFVPSAAAVLADWGAQVIKVEQPVGGDPVRSMRAWGIEPGAGGVTFLWEVFNRGKDAIAIDLTSAEGREVLWSLVERADVFLTNLLPATSAKLGVDAATVTSRHPRIVYGRGSAHGPRGPMATQGGFDGITYWSAGGASLSARPYGHDEPIPMPGPGFGDIQAGAQLAGAVAAALFNRERTGQGSVVDHSLMAAGLWAMQPSIAGCEASGVEQLAPVDRRHPDTPGGTWYRTSDDRWVFLGFNQPDVHWAAWCVLIEREDLTSDVRFATESARQANLTATVDVMESIFASRTLAEWQELLGRQRGPWAVHRTPWEAAHDPQAAENGYVHTVSYDGGAVLQLVAAPGQFDGATATLRAAPAHGANTRTVLSSIGMDRDEIDRLHRDGVVVDGASGATLGGHR